MNYVYVIQLEDQDLFKVGFSNSPATRLAGLQSSTPYQLRLVRTIGHPRAEDLERAAHKELSEFRTRGEWFVCPLSTVLDALFAASARVEQDPRPVPRERNEQDRINAIDNAYNILSEAPKKLPRPNEVPYGKRLLDEAARIKRGG